MSRIRPKVGDRVIFNKWFDTQYLGRIHTEPGNDIDRPSDLAKWAGEVISIEKPQKTLSGNRRYLSSVNKYTIKRDFDGYEQELEIRDILGYANQ